MSSVEEYQAIVRGRKAKREVTRRVIERDDVLKVAGTQGDAIRVIENLPGTARDSGGGGGPANGPVLRGSNPGDSKGYIEGYEIPILYHFGGLRSTFNSAFLESVDFVPETSEPVWPRHRGVVEVNVRDLAKDMFRGMSTLISTMRVLCLRDPSVQIGLWVGHFTGPISIRSCRSSYLKKFRSHLTPRHGIMIISSSRKDLCLVMMTFDFSSLALDRSSFSSTTLAMTRWPEAT